MYLLIILMLNVLLIIRRTMKRRTHVIKARLLQQGNAEGDDESVSSAEEGEVE